MKQKIIEDLSSGHFEITVHAPTRMSERVVTKEDLMEVGRTVTSAKHQNSPNAPYKVSGKDLEGEMMNVICDYIDKTFIVTVITR